MKIKTAKEKAAHAWCAPGNKCKIMDVELANAFANILRHETAPLEDELEMAWAIIANAGGGDWDRESPEWREAAAKWCDRYHALVASQKVDDPPRTRIRDEAINPDTDTILGSKQHTESDAVNDDDTPRMTLDGTAKAMKEAEVQNAREQYFRVLNHGGSRIRDEALEGGRNG